MSRSSRPHRPLTQRKRFTPSSPANASPQSYLLFFRDSGERFIVQKTSIKRIEDGQATVKIGLKERVAEIEAQGTFSLCQAMLAAKCGMMSAEDQENNDTQRDVHDDVTDDFDVPDDDSVDDLTNFATIRRNGHHTTANLSPLPLNRNDRARSETPPSHSRPMSRSSPARQKRQRSPSSCHDDDDDDDGDDAQVRHVAKSKKSTSDAVDGAMIREHIDSLFTSMMESTERQLKHLSRKVDRLQSSSMFDQSLDVFREKDEQHPAAVVYEQTDLLKIRAKDYGAYARLVLRKLFSQDELTTSILPPGGGRYRRLPLDAKKFEHLHQAVAAKYRISRVHYDDFYNKLLRPKLTDFLIDERKRRAKRNSLVTQNNTTNQMIAVVRDDAE